MQDTTASLRLWSRRGLAAVALAWAPFAWAQFIDSSSLFLAPTEVPTAIYDPIDLSPGASRSFSIADVSGATQLLGVHVLPILNENPFNTAGFYTPGDLASINVTNYATFYAFQPNVDYRATTISGNATTLTFDQSGVYYVQLETSNGALVSDTVFRVQADDFLAEDPAAGAKDATGAERKLTTPKTDLTIISDGDPNDNGAMTNAMKQFPDAVKAKTVQDVIDAIKKYYDEHGKKKFEVTIIGHGRSGSIKIGNQRINNEAGAAMTPADFQKAVDPYLASIHFLSCSTASGDSGTQFMKDIRSSIKDASAPDKPITMATTYVDIEAGGKLVSEVPEPQTVVLLLIGIALVLLRSRSAARR